MADGGLPGVENDMNETVPFLPGTDEADRTTISSRPSLSTSAAQAAKLKRILSEKKLEQL